MHPALWVSKTGLDAQQTAITDIANNLANVNTVGFKRSKSTFEDLLYQTVQQPGGQTSETTASPSGLMLGTGVHLVSTQKIHTQGNILQTGNALDIAISGRGFLQIQMPNGQTNYTRNGQLQLDANGQLVTASGYVVQPPITIPNDSRSITIGRDGTVSVITGDTSAVTQVGTLQLADFVNPAGLQPVGENLFTETASSGSPTVGAPAVNGLGSILQDSLESSNVNVVEELVNMIQTQRAYEMNSKAIQTADSMLQYVSQVL